MAIRGRPRAFEPDVALRRAMEVFWEHGYEGASMAELTRAMGINSPSLYATFGGKERLFKSAVELYGNEVGAITFQALDGKPTAREAVAAMLLDNVVAFTEPGHPRGCMIVLAANNCTPQNESVRQYLAGLRSRVLAAIKHRLDAGVVAGELPAGTDTSALAMFYATVHSGLSIQARDGHSRKRLRGAAEAAMAAWDTLVPRRS